MWRPQNPVKHPLPEAQWPGRDEAARSLLFRPLHFGPFRLENRTWVPAMVPWRATEDGYVTRDNLDWYERFARGRPGGIVLEATGVRDIRSGPLLRIGHDRYIPGFRELVARVRRASGGHTRIFIQLIDFLTVKRRPQPETFFQRFFHPTNEHREALVRATGDPRWHAAAESELRLLLTTAPGLLLESVLSDRELEALRYGYRERVTDMHLPHVRELPVVLPDIFAAAAARARKAGFDGVELHYAHAYTMASFLSARNDRPDGYGCTLEGRARLPLEVYSAVRARVGADYTVGVRFLSDEVIAGGSRIEDAIYFAGKFAAAGFDYLSISKGGKFEDARQPKVGAAVYPYTGHSGYECMPSVVSDAAGPFSRNIPLVKPIKQAINSIGFNTPVIGSGGITTFQQAEGILQDEAADIVAFARQALADPDWFTKVKLGLGEQVRRCTYTNYCEGLDQSHKQVTCKLWDREQLEEPRIAMSNDGRRRLVAPEWKAPAVVREEPGD